MHVHGLIASITTALLLAACGPKEAETEGGTETDPGSSGTTGTPTASGTLDPTTGAQQTCDDPSVAEVGPEVTVHLKNDGASPIFVDRRVFCSAADPFSIVSPGGETLHTGLGLCDFSCAVVLAEDCGCQAGCGDPGRVVQIDPGVTYTVAWSGEHWADATLPAECVGTCGESCLAREQAPAGMYKVVARASGQVEGCDDCGCVGDSAGDSIGWCEIEGARAGEEVVVEGALDYPAQTEITLVFP